MEEDPEDSVPHGHITSLVIYLKNKFNMWWFLMLCLNVMRHGKNNYFCQKIVISLKDS